MIRRISSSLALIFVFSLGQFALALNTTAPTIATTTSAQDVRIGRIATKVGGGIEGIAIRG